MLEACDERTVGIRSRRPVAGRKLSHAVKAWSERLGAENVIRSGSRLDALNRSTFQHTNRLACAIYPGSRQDVEAALAIARSAGIALHVVSRGCNWGYGSRIPSTRTAVLLSLERMQRIAIDETLAKVSIEPGVTFAELADALHQSGSRLLAPEIGAGPETSVLGNALQRGIGKGPYACMGSQLIGLDVLMPDGTRLSTGTAPFVEEGAGSRSGSAGPSAIGIFQQSEIGVVVAASLALHPAPKLRQTLWYRVKAARLPALMNAARALLQAGDPRLQIEFMNGQRVELQTHGELQLAVDRIDAEWLVASTSWADDTAEMSWRQRRARKALSRFSASCGALAVEKVSAIAVKDWSGLNSAYAFLGREAGPGADPDRDGCGLIWVAPEVPFRTDAVAEVLPLIEGTMSQFGIPPALSMRPLAGRDLRMLVAVAFDRREPGRNAAAIECAAALRSALTSAGYGFYRTGVLDRGDDREQPGARPLIDAISDRFDSQGILGRDRRRMTQ